MAANKSQSKPTPVVELVPLQYRPGMTQEQLIARKEWRTLFLQRIGAVITLAGGVAANILILRTSTNSLASNARQIAVENASIRDARQAIDDDNTIIARVPEAELERAVPIAQAYKDRLAKDADERAKQLLAKDPFLSTQYSEKDVARTIADQVISNDPDANYQTVLFAKKHFDESRADIGTQKSAIAKSTVNISMLQRLQSYQSVGGKVAMAVNTVVFCAIYPAWLWRDKRKSSPGAREA